MKIAAIIISISATLFLNQKPIDLYGTYRTKDLHRGECLSNLILKKDNSFKYREQRSNIKDSILGTWSVKSDTLFLNFNNADIKACLEKHLQIVEIKENFEIRSFKQRKSICKDCNTYTKISSAN